MMNKQQESHFDFVQKCLPSTVQDAVIKVYLNWMWFSWNSSEINIFDIDIYSNPSSVQSLQRGL